MVFTQQLKVNFLSCKKKMPDTCRFVHRLSDRNLPKGAGNKALNLRFLQKQDCLVPETFVCTWQACSACSSGDPVGLGQLKKELSSLIVPGRSYAVRSSAEVEDGSAISYAGQFRTFLDVSGVDGVIRAIQDIHPSARAACKDEYHARISDIQEVRMAVLVQKMVEPVISGVSFSRNPITGLNEILVEAVRGSGELLVQGGITPMRWVFKWGEYVSRPSQTDIPESVVDTIVSETKRIARRFRRPADLEWVWDGSQLWWVQLREITAIEGIPVYSNLISRELLPGMIKPLIWSINIPLVNTAWIRLFSELIGHTDLKPEDLARQFHYRAYFSLTAVGRIFQAMGFPQETLELLLGIESTGPEKPRFRPSARTMRLLPRMLRTFSSKLFFSRRVESLLDPIRSEYDHLNAVALDRMDDEAMLEHIERLQTLGVEAAYFNIVVPLLMQIYNRLVERRLRRSGLDFGQYDPAIGLSELEEYDPKILLAELHRRFEQFDEKIRVSILSDGYSALEEENLEEFKRGVDDFLRRFGHFSDIGTDFSSVPWRESPDSVVRMIAEFCPPVRPSMAIRKTEQAMRSPLSRFILRRARQFRVYRERISSLYTYGYGLFRNAFMELGLRFVQRRVIERWEDIFFLYLDEVRRIVSGDLTDLMSLVKDRRQEMKAVENVALPTIIFGDDTPPFYEDVCSKLKGTPTSRGYYQGPVRVIRTTGDSSKLRNGDVLIIPFSDIGWTPLFGKAGAVVSDSGGILSHSSIIAREYGIPAVVSVPGALNLKDGTVVSVDGYRGEITIKEEHE